jgi:hypothetical protein
MSHAKAMRRLGLLGVVLGMGAAVAATSAIASADSTDIDAAAFDPSALIADPAPAAAGLDLAISIDGQTLFQEGTAVAYSGTDDIAIAYGSDSIATASDGTGDYSFADGTDAQANSGIGDDDSAVAVGSGSAAAAGSGNGDSAFADGADTDVVAGGDYTPGTPDTVDVAGDDCYASAVGNNDFAYAGPDVGSVPSTTDVTGDIATIIGNSSDAWAGAGNYDFAGALGEAVMSNATGANFLFELMPSL